MRRVGWRILVLTAGAAACGGGNGDGPGPMPSQVVRSGGDNQVGPAGLALGSALEVTVLDASGAPLANIPVAWAAASGGGSVTPTSGMTGSNGTATASRTLGPGAGTQTTTATVAGVASATFTHVAQIQGATQMAASGPIQRSDSVLSTAPFSVVIRDQNSAPVAGVIVTWSVGGGGGALSQLLDTTDANGIAAVALTLTQTAGARTVQASVSGLQGSPVAFTETVTAGTATQMALAGGNGQAGPVSTALPTPHAVVARDAYGNPKLGVTVAWTVGENGGSISTPSPQTDGTGVASVVRTLGVAVGAYTDTARITGLSGSPVVFTDTAGPVTTVQVQNNFFQPTPDTVAVGTFVRFAWAGGVGHNVTWDNGPIPLPTDSPTQTSGTFTVRLTQLGTYNYHCSIHGSPGAGMHGTLVTQ
jgi:plastocyanin